MSSSSEDEEALARFRDAVVHSSDIKAQAFENARTVSARKGDSSSRPSGVAVAFSKRTDVEEEDVEHVRSGKEFRRHATSRLHAVLHKAVDTSDHTWQAGNCSSSDSGADNVDLFSKQTHSYHKKNQKKEAKRLKHRAVELEKQRKNSKRRYKLPHERAESSDEDEAQARIREAAVSAEFVTNTA